MIRSTSVAGHRHLGHNLPQHWSRRHLCRLCAIGRQRQAGRRVIPLLSCTTVALHMLQSRYKHAVQSTSPGQTFARDTFNGTRVLPSTCAATMGALILQPASDVGHGPAHMARHVQRKLHARSKWG
jgi:hypothetical protein